jgi:hypothetical protein
VCPLQLKFKVFMAVIVKVAVFWDVTPYSQVELSRRLGGKRCACLQGISHSCTQLGRIPEENYFHSITTLL